MTTEDTASYELNTTADYDERSKVTTYSWSSAETNNLQEEAARFTAFQVGQAIHRFYFPVMVIVGLVGNTLSLLVMLQRNNRRISCCIHMAALAVSDFIAMSIGGYYWLNSVALGIGIGPWTCSYVGYLAQVVACASILLVVVMTLDRFLAVCYPLKSLEWCRPHQACKAVAGIAVASCIYCLPYIKALRLSNNKKVCAAILNTSTAARIYSWVVICMGSVVPFVILVTLNTLIIQAVYQGTKFSKIDSKSRPDAPKNKTTKEGSSSSSSRHSNSKTRDRQLTTMLLLVTFMFLLVTLPQYTHHVLYAVFINPMSHPETYANYVLVHEIASKLYWSNSMWNFFLYCISGSKFRNDLARLFNCQKSAQHVKNSDGSIKSVTGGTIENI